MQAPTGPLPEPTATVMRSCREVITAAGTVTSMLAHDPRAAVAALEQVNPALAGPLASMFDAVMDLDARTGFLGPDAPL